MEVAAHSTREVSHIRVIVPFDQANFCVLGGAPEPYANNPLRIPGVTAAFAGAQKQQGRLGKADRGSGRS